MLYKYYVQYMIRNRDVAQNIYNYIYNFSRRRGDRMRLKQERKDGNTRFLLDATGIKISSNNSHF
jgi:hypothetical protein